MIHQYFCQPRPISRCDYDVRTFPAAVCRVFGRGAVGGAVEQDSPPAAAPAVPNPAFWPSREKELKPPRPNNFIPCQGRFLFQI